MVLFELWDTHSGVYMGTFGNVENLEEYRAAYYPDADRFEVAICEGGVSSLYVDTTRFVSLAEFRVEFAEWYDDIALDRGEGWHTRLDEE